MRILIDLCFLYHLSKAENCEEFTEWLKKYDEFYHSDMIAEVQEAIDMSYISTRTSWQYERIILSGDILAISQDSPETYRFFILKQLEEMGFINYSHGKTMDYKYYEDDDVTYITIYKD